MDKCLRDNPNHSVEKLKLSELRALGKIAQIPFYYKMRKRDLQVALILDRITVRTFAEKPTVYVVIEDDEYKKMCTLDNGHVMKYDDYAEHHYFAICKDGKYTFIKPTELYCFCSSKCNDCYCHETTVCGCTDIYMVDKYMLIMEDIVENELEGGGDGFLNWGNKKLSTVYEKIQALKSI